MKNCLSKTEKQRDLKQGEKGKGASENRSKIILIAMMNPGGHISRNLSFLQ